MKNYLMGAAIFALAFALSLGYADNKSEKSKEIQIEKTVKSCCAGKASAEIDDHCIDDAKGSAEETSMKVENVSDKPSCSSMWDKMASKDSKADCCKGEKSEKVKVRKVTKKAG